MKNSKDARERAWDDSGYKVCQLMKISDLDEIEEIRIAYLESDCPANKKGVSDFILQDYISKK